ncbi:LicD family protein [Oribacterium parvum]|uniref:LicD family protein n=1 Tax=Oribacterium parvum TaxID=1501329 RepID=UPI0028DB4AD1|nr:LicD family protein [Oribacterium parvum]
MEFEREFFYDEVRDGFYIPGIIKRLWAAELTVLSDIDRICKKYDIPYYADGGTLLGAVRDGNFIPWDDDIDIMMLREDYDRFQDVLKDELPEGLSLNTLETKRNYYSFFSTISTTEIGFQSRLLEKYRDYPFIVSVDIFVIDELSGNVEEENRRKEILSGFLAIINRLNENPVKDDTFQEELNKLEELINMRFDSSLPFEKQLYKAIETEVCQFNGKGKGMLACVPWHCLQAECQYPKSAFHKTKWVPFSNTTIPIPEGFDVILSAEYGDYKIKRKGADTHNYPYFKKYEEVLKKYIREKEEFYYSFSEEDLIRPEVQNIRDLLMLTVERFCSSHQELMKKLENKELFACLQRLSIMQEEAITLGNIIEQKKGEGTESVFMIEGYCEALYEVHQSILEQIAKDDFSKVPFSVRKDLKEKMKHVETCLDNLQYALKKDFKKQVVFLPHSAKHFESLRPLVDALLQDEEIDCKIIPIPYYDKCGDGRLKKIHYDGLDFPKEYKIVDYNCYDFLVDFSDCIIINSPYDEYNPVWTVDPQFYSREIKKYTKKLAYIPWFVTDEINPEEEEDRKAFINMEYYVNVPGIFHSDLSIVQSEGMKNAYLAKIEEFAGKDVAKKMEKKIAGAGSCLLGDKEGQGIKEVIECFKSFL